jgi:toxin CptA
VKSAPATGFRYRASRGLILATLAVAALASIAAWLGAWPAPAGFASTLVIALCTGITLGNLLRPRVRSVLWRADGGADIALRDRQGDGYREVHGTIHGARMMGPLITLTLRWPPHGRATLWLLPDNLDADVRRRLRMRLRTGTGGRLASGNADSG